ncbi:4-hydroxy-tetrahydrodipicolinate reductase [soil metagenome]
MSTPIRIGIVGISGRMGGETASVARTDPRVTLVGGVIRPGSTYVGESGELITEDVADLLLDVDVLLDLSLPAATATIANATAKAGVPLLCGVTGIDENGLRALEAAASTIPVHWSRNLSVGIPVIADLLRQLAVALAGFDVEITETHHRGKRDAPSGTALILAEAIAGSRDQTLSDHTQYGRHGESLRKPQEIGIHSLRAGALPGEHSVLFASDDEELRVSHRALSRRAFAKGAVDAACALVGCQPGLRIT